MAAAHKKPSHSKGWRIGLSRADRWEAPDRKFAGHRDILTRSLARYHFVATYLQGRVLDVGCGRGYGFEVIAPQTTAQVGIDISCDFLREAKEKFTSVAFACASGDALPFCDNAFDSVISFEVIEHIQNDEGFLRELKRVARDDAFLAVSTPNKLVSSGNVDQPCNPFHVREYTPVEFDRLLSQVFSSVTLLGQHERDGGTISVNGLRNRLVNLIPVRWKYLLPAHIQDRMSVILRPPLRLEECRFQAEDIDKAHTLVALCRP
jgi:SAM-dependent methyltransferase